MMMGWLKNRRKNREINEMLSPDHPDHLKLMRDVQHMVDAEEDIQRLVPGIPLETLGMLKPRLLEAWVDSDPKPATHDEALTFVERWMDEMRELGLWDQRKQAQ